MHVNGGTWDARADLTVTGHCGADADALVSALRGRPDLPSPPGSRVSLSVEYPVCGQPDGDQRYVYPHTYLIVDAPDASAAGAALEYALAGLDLQPGVTLTCSRARLSEDAHEDTGEQ